MALLSFCSLTCWLFLWLCSCFLVDLGSNIWKDIRKWLQWNKYEGKGNNLYSSPCWCATEQDSHYMGMIIFPGVRKCGTASLCLSLTSPSNLISLIPMMANWPPCHPATLPPCHPATLPPCHPATLPPCHPGTVSQRFKCRSYFYFRYWILGFSGIGFPVGFNPVLLGLRYLMCLFFAAWVVYRNGYLLLFL